LSTSWTAVSTLRSIADVRAWAEQDKIVGEIACHEAADQSCLEEGVKPIELAAQLLRSREMAQ
jgi:hypothetical protein